jgi:hypothetical protein
MLSQLSPADAAQPTRVRSAAGISLFGGCVAVPRVHAMKTAVAGTAASEAAFARVRPPASAGPVLFGNATHRAGQANPARQQRTSQKYAPMTRIAAAGGGALGSHPARDPV